MYRISADSECPRSREERRSGTFRPRNSPHLPVIEGRADYGRIPLRLGSPASFLRKIIGRKFIEIPREFIQFYLNLSNFSEIRFSSNEPSGSAIIPESPSRARLANAGKFMISPAPEAATGHPIETRNRGPRSLHRTRPADDVPAAAGRFRQRRPAPIRKWNENS